MTTITILPETADSYRALAGEKESTGRTPGEALDALSAQLGDDESGTLVIVQNRKADEFFTAAQQERLTELMQRHEAGSLSPEEEQELERLVEAEIAGARERSQILADAISHGERYLPLSCYPAERFEDENADKLSKILSDTLKDGCDEILTVLNGQDQQLLKMYYLEELPLEEIAQQLVMSPQQAITKLRRARLRLMLRRLGDLSKQT